jgi:hypothetical protein
MDVKLRRAGIGLLVAAAVGGGATAVAASGGDANHDGAIGAASHARSAPAARTAASTTFGNLAVTAHVDTVICASGAIQCPSAVAASGGNSSPIRVVFQVLNGASGVNSLTAASFNVQTGFVPAGGQTLNKMTCASCFGSGLAGQYQLFLQPSSGTWRSGHYYPQVKIATPSGTKIVTLDVEIP